MQTQTAYQELNVESWKSWFPKRGEIYYCDLEGAIDNEQRGVRPVVILSNNKGNLYGNILVVAAITTKKKHLPQIHVPINLKTDSYILTEHIRTVSKSRFFINNNYPVKITILLEKKMIEVENAIKFELGFIT
jgi:mRNA interferase MazF